MKRLLKLLPFLFPGLIFAGNAPVDTSAQNVFSLMVRPDLVTTKIQADSFNRLIIRYLNQATDATTVYQGTTHWDTNITQLLGAAPSVTNTFPYRQSNGTSFADFGAGTTTSATPRSSVNITRNGNEWSYNNGASDANTPRVAANFADGAGTKLTSTLVGSAQALDSNTVHSVLPDGASTEATLSAFKTANHTDSLLIDSDLLAFKSANHTDSTQIDSDLLAFKSANHTDTAQLDTDLLAFKTANHTDTTQVDTDVLAFKSANHTDLGANSDAAPASDTASGSINGILKRLNVHGTNNETNQGTIITQLTSIFNELVAISAQLPATLGQKIASLSFSVVLASDIYKGTPNQVAVTCAAASTQLLAAAAATNAIMIQVPSTSLFSIWINTTGVAAVAAPPSIELKPGDTANFRASQDSYLPTTAINCISSGASGINIGVFYK